MAIPREVIELVERFSLNADSYRSAGYNEATLRHQFLDPLFMALGWDVLNKGGTAEAYKDVLHEESIKVGGATKAPDYCFRFGSVPKFFVEAKKPAVNIKEDASPAYQLRRYAWSAKLPLSILSDFEEFAVYDCRIKPAVTDSAATGRILLLGYQQYAVRWDEIASIFSREAVRTGSFDKYAETTRGKRGTAEVDAAFLNDIETWRDELARMLALRNPRLTQRELNFAVQRTIDRIIFLRIAEDRGIEPHGQLLALVNGEQVYRRLVEMFERADERYNSGLFHFQRERDRAEPPDELTLALKLDDKPLKEIIRSLYYPDSPYEISVLPADILGQVYEQFLGKVIRLTGGHRAVVEDKPEVKKAGGVYYTPTYIVEYIVKHTVGKLLGESSPSPLGEEGRGEESARRMTPKQAAKLRVLDPACGSSSFLIGAYQYLLDWYRDRYVEAGPEKHTKELYQGPGNGWRLTTTERKRILLANIYGVDIDPQAVEVTKLSLLLKVLEGESQQSLGRQRRLLHERALPDLGNNIKSGNSLIGPDFYDGQQMSLLDDDERLRINAFDWHAEFPAIMKAGGFDAVIGNPPYDVLEKERGAASWPHNVLSDYCRKKSVYENALGGKLNLFRFFVVAATMLAKRGARFGMIVPLAILGDISCAKSRRHLFTRLNDLEADCFPQKDNASRRVFLNAKLSTTILTGSVTDSVQESTAGIHTRIYPWNTFSDKPRENVVQIVDTKTLDSENMPVPLTDSRNWALCLKVHRRPDVRRLAEIEDFNVRRGEINQTVNRKYIHAEPRGMKRLLKGVEIGRFRTHDTLKQGIREWFDESAFHAAGKDNPLTYRPRLAMQRITGVDERSRIVATLITPPVYFADSTNSITSNDQSPYDLRYLLGLLNSKLYQWRFKITSSNNNVGTNELLTMPFRTIEFRKSVEKSGHDRMVELGESMLTLHRQLAGAKTAHERTALERQIEATDRQIDRLVYELYGLTDEEIAVVEGATR